MIEQEERRQMQASKLINELRNIPFKSLQYLLLKNYLDPTFETVLSELSQQKQKAEASRNFRQIQSISLLSEFFKISRDKGVDNALWGVNHDKSALVNLIPHNVKRALSKIKKNSKNQDISKEIHQIKELLNTAEIQKIPIVLGECQYYLGTLLSRQNDNKAENIEQAISCYCLAQKVLTKNSFPLYWAQIQNDLGVAYFDRLVGDPSENINKAFLCYVRALRVRTRKALPYLWAQTKHNQGLAFRTLAKLTNNYSSTMDASIRCFRNALKFRTQEKFPIDWAKTTYNLAFSYSEATSRDRGKNIEDAITCLHEAERVYTRKFFKLDWSMLQNILGNSYQQRIVGVREKNLDAAIKCYKKALGIRTADNFPILRSNTLLNLGIAYLDHIYKNQVTHQEKAIECYQEAILLRNGEANPFYQATLLHNFSLIYKDRIKGIPSENLGKALELATSALNILQETPWLIDKVRIKETIGHIYNKFYSITGDAAAFERATSYYKEALYLKTPDAFPSDSRSIYIELGNLYIQNKDYLEAFRVFESAEAADKNATNNAILDQSIKHEFTFGSQLYFNASWCLAKLGRYKDSLEWLEKGKCRSLSEVIALSRFQEAITTPQLKVKCEALLGKLNALRTQRISTCSNADELRKTWNKLKDLVSTFYPDFDSETQTLETVSCILQDESVAIIEYNITKWGTVVFILFKKEGSVQVETKFVEEFTLSKLEAITVEWFKKYKKFKHSRYPTKIEITAWGNYISNLVQLRLSKLLPPIITRKSAIDACKLRRFILIPHLSLHLFPLHLFCDYTADGKEQEYSVSYAPSLTILSNIQKDRSAFFDNFLGIPGIKEDTETGEVSKISRYFESKARIFSISEFGIPVLLNELKKYGYLHFSCHGEFCINDPYKSCLLWNHNEDFDEEKVSFGNSSLLPGQCKILELIDIFTKVKLNKTRLVVLSACESGVSDIANGTDELLSFPAGFLYAGASSVVSTLWKVNSRATRRFMITFYENLRKMSAPEALILAQTNLKKTKRFRSPSYWGAFYLTGQP